MLTMKEVSEIAFSAEEYVCVIFRAYLDDSADQKREKLVLFGGFVGKPDEWDNKFRPRWKSCLRKNSIGYFRESEYRWLTDEFERFSDPVQFPKPAGRDAARAIRAELKTVIDSTDIRGFSVGVFIPDYEEVLAMDEFKGRMNPSAEDAAFQSIIYEIARRIRKLPGHHRVTFVTDLSSRSDHLSQIYREFVEKNPLTAKVTGGVTHLNDETTPALQAADLAAHLAHDVLLDRLRTEENPQPGELREKTSLIAYWDKDYLLEVLRTQENGNALVTLAP